MTRTSRLSTLLSRSQDGRLRANRKKLASRRMVLENLEGRCVLSSISGIVFNDANGNGSQDGGELPLAGITVFHETDGNSILDAGEDSAVTGADGSYLFNFAGPTGTYHYGSAIIPVGESTGRWVNTNNNYQGVPVETGATVDAVMNFGFRFVPYAGNFYPVGGESLVNQTTTGQEGTAETYESFDANTIAADNAGNYAVTWLSPQANLQDQVFVRVFNADGTPRTGEILVGTASRASSAYIPQMPVVAMSADGSRLAVSWDSYSAPTATSTPLVRTYNAVTGSPVTSAVVVSPYNTKEGLSVTGIAMDSNGDFAVLMTGAITTKGHLNDGVTLFQRFTSSGAAAGSRTQVVDANLMNGQQGIAMDGAGNFVVVWQDATGTSGGIFAQRYTAAGATAGSRITVATDPPGKSSDNRSPSVAMNSSGTFVVTWSTGVLSLNTTKVAQVFNAAGQPLGSNVTIVSSWLSTCAGTAIDSAGNVTVAWTATQQRGPNGSSTSALDLATDVRVRRLNADGSLSDTMVVNTSTEGHQYQTCVAATGSGFIVAWNGRGAGDDAGVFTQRYTTTPPPAAPAGAASLDAASVDFLMASDTTKR
jgi:hypothetical protein